MPDSLHSKFNLVLLGVICAGALLVRLEGIAWPRLHPDEPVIGNWIEKSAQGAYIKDRVYPGGCFVLTRPFVWINKVFSGVHQRVAYWCGGIDRVRQVKIEGILLGRLLNAAAGTAICVFIYLLASRITGSARGGLFAATLVAFCQYAVEHSHYAETDIAALLMLSFAFWLWSVTGNRATPRLFALAALASGFAAGTKFTLMILAPIVVIEAVLFAWRNGKLDSAGPEALALPQTVDRRPSTVDCQKAVASRPRRLDLWLHVLKLTCLAILLFGIGFAIANPALILKFNWFWDNLAAEQKRVFAETALNLGAAAAQPGVKYIHHAQLLFYHLKTLDYPWLVLIALGVPFTILSPARGCWPILILFPLLYAVYWVFMAPWVRSQEFLLFLPSFAALAVVPLAMLWRSRLFAGKAFGLLLAVAAIAASGLNGMRVAGLFGWKDTRRMANEWLQVRLPLENRMAVESYAETACPPVLNPPLNIRKIERDGFKPLVDRGAGYLLRTATISGRGLRHPLTGELYPEAADNLKQLMTGGALLCSWAPMPPQGQDTFVSPAIELYGLKNFTPQVSVRAELPQPALIVNGDQNPVGRRTFCPIGHKLGCADALLIDRRPQTIAVGGPKQLAGPVYLALNTLERPAVIHIRGFGLRRKVALEPYDTAVVPLMRSVWRPAVRPFEKIILQAEPVEDVVYIPCFARIAWTVSEAARICIETARAEKITEQFPEAALERELSSDLKYILGAKLGRPSGRREIAGWRERITQCLQSEAPAISLNGINGYYYDQFARARLQSPYDLAGGPQAEEYARSPLGNAVKILDLQLPEDGREISADPTQLYSQTFAIPALLARGRYELRGEIMLTLNEPADKPAVSLKTVVAAGNETAGEIDLQPGQWRDFAFTLRPGREVQPQIVFSLPLAGRVHLRNMEIVWNLASALASLRDELSALEIQPDNGTTVKPAPEVQNAVKNPPVFTPWCKLVEFSLNAETREVNCVFEALRDDTPKLAVNFWILRRGEWRRKQVQALGSRKLLNKGERETVTVRLNDVFGAWPDINKIGLGMETDVLWHAGAIPAESGAGVIPFARLAGENRKTP